MDVREIITEGVDENKEQCGLFWIQELTFDPHKIQENYWQSKGLHTA
jgi:hypothetical protein